MLKIFIQMPKSKTYTVLAIDPGKQNCGFAVVQLKNRLASISKTGVIQGTNLENLADKFLVLIKKYKPQELILERIYFYLNRKSGIEVSERIGVLKYLAQSRKLKTTTLSPSELKNLISGNGTASKEELETVLKWRFPGLKLKTHHEIDALALAVCALDRQLSPVKI